jgi:hypothetical protein
MNLVQGLHFLKNTVIFLRLELELDDPAFLVEEPLPVSVGLAQRVPARIAELIDLVVSSGAGIDVGCVWEDVRSLRNRWEERGLKRVMPVLRCLVRK